MKVATGDGIMAMLVALALIVVCLRFFTRIRLENRRPIASDYVALAGWFCSVGWVICMALQYSILEKNGNPSPDSPNTSVTWLKVVYASLFFFDFGLMLPKISITMFYWWLIPRCSTKLRVTLWICTIYAGCAFVGTFLSDVFFCHPITDNWSVANQDRSVWNSKPNTYVNWAFNISTDVILFLLPAVLFNSVRLRRPQKLILVSVFSLGLITIVVSICRLAAPSTGMEYEFAPPGAIWFTAEMCTATIVVCLPSLKNLLVKVVESCGGSFAGAQAKQSDIRTTNRYRHGVWTGEGDVEQASMPLPATTMFRGSHDGRASTEYNQLPDFAFPDAEREKDHEADGSTKCVEILYPVDTCNQASRPAIPRL